jgi:3-dehydro-L-gulonate 2-dehydrogenase
LRVPYSELVDQLTRVLQGRGFSPERAALSAALFADASRDGVHSHGLNRFPSYLDNIRKGRIDIHAEPVKVQEAGALERWDGRRGPGNLNAYASMQRAIELAREYGMGCVALRNTNHWMRPGSYGLQAADAGCIGICWTNTLPNMPPWGAKDQKIGNNPIVFAVPRAEGHILLDTAMSQYSYGQLAEYRKRGEELPVPGGFGPDGEPSTDAGQVLQTGRVMPIGYWKGSGLSIVLDMIAMLLAGGRSTVEIGRDEGEQAISQVFIAFDQKRLGDGELLGVKLEAIIDDLHQAQPVTEGGKIRFPGEDTIRRREDSLLNGVEVDPVIWQSVLDEGQ